MRLIDWLRANDRDLEWLAAKVGCDPSHVSKLHRGLTRPSGELAAKIELATNGKVTAVDHEAVFRERKGDEPLSIPADEDTLVNPRPAPAAPALERAS